MFGFGLVGVDDVVSFLYFFVDFVEGGIMMRRGKTFYEGLVFNKKMGHGFRGLVTPDGFLKLFDGKLRETVVAFTVVHQIFAVLAKLLKKDVDFEAEIHGFEGLKVKRLESYKVRRLEG